MHLISVIVPVYKVERYLSRCVDSLLSQTFRDFELILVDDGSPDECGRMCEEYARLDSRVITLHRKNGGLSAARNTGLDWAFANSDSKYIAFVDSDDWVEHNYLETLVNGITLGADVSSVCCRYVHEGLSESGTPPQMRIDKCHLMSPKDYWLHVNLYMTAWGKLYDKRLWKNLRYPEGRVHEDEYVAHKLLFSGKDIAVSTTPLYCYFQRQGSIMQNGNKARKLDLIGAFSSQVEFFRDKGIQDLKLQAQVKLLRIYVYAVKELKKAEYKVKLREELQNGEVRVIDCPEAYRMLYPIQMMWLWPYLRIKDVVARRGLIGAFCQWIKRGGRDANQ